MLSVPVVDVSGKEVGTYEFDPADLASSVNKQLLHDVVVMYLRNRRVGTVRTKSRGMVAGSKKKMYRQKGTGRARMGNKRTAKRRGGGHTFAKVPVDYYYRLPKKAVRLATRMALLSKFQDGQAVVLNDLPLTEPKTKPVAAMLKAVGVAGVSTLLVLPAYDKTAYLSARNVADLETLPVSDLNAYTLLRQKRLVILKSALDKARSQSGPTDTAA
jgi:large subunit ribosomal protein L4